MSGEVISGVLGLIGTGIEAANQRRMQEIAHQYNMEETEHAAGLNYMYNEMAANNADERTRAQFNDLYSPEARVQQLKNAGLSVGLMYGAGGTIGQGQAQGAQGAGAAGQQGKANSAMASSLGIAQILSNIRVNESIANKNNTEAESIRGQEGTTGWALIQQRLSEAGLNETKSAVEAAKQKLLEAQTTAQGIENYINSKTLNYQINGIKWQTESAWTDLQKNVIEKDIAEETKQTVIDQYKADLQKTYIDTLVSISQGRLNSAKAQEAMTRCQLIAQQITESESLVEWRGNDIELREEVNKIAREKIENDKEIANIYADAKLEAASITSSTSALVDLTELLTLTEAQKKAKSQGRRFGTKPARKVINL